jgi:hypothetical protein
MVGVLWACKLLGAWLQRAAAKPETQRLGDIFEWRPMLLHLGCFVDLGTERVDES